jgi:acetyl esterase/lipase
VTWAFLALAVLFLLLTINSFRPVRRNRWLFAPSFFASWLTNELAPFYLLALIALALGGIVVLGVEQESVGWVALGVVAATWVLLAAIYFKSTKAGGEIEEALGEFGADQPKPHRASRSKYRKIKDVPFARVGGRTLRLDVTIPRDDAERRPAVLQIHGGGWVIGDKREPGLPLLKRLASNGWVGFNANYRLSPGATWPDHLVDCKRALAWIREHADEYGVDPSYVVVTGGSAGGHLTAMMALTAGDLSYQPGFEDADCSLQAAVPFYGVYDFTNRLDSATPQMRTWVLEPLVMKAFYDDDPDFFRSASPMDRVHPDAPPFFVLHGNKDTLAPVVDAREFVRLLVEQSGNKVFYAELDGAQHAFDIFSSPRTRRALNGVQRFLYESYREHLAELRSSPVESLDAAGVPEPPDHVDGTSQAPLDRGMLDHEPASASSTSKY